MRLLLTSLAILTILPAVQAQHKSRAAAKSATPAAPAFGNADAISEDELRISLYFLASDVMEGRNLPSRGFDTAALYIASRLAEFGLKPMGSTSNTDGPLQPYLMPFELVTKHVIAESAKASLTAPPARGGRGNFGGGGRGESTGPRTTDFEYSKDWTVVAGGRGAPPLTPFDADGKMAFAGNGYVIHKTNIDPYQGLDVHGKIIVVAGLPPELAAQQARGRGGRGQNPLGEACKDFLTPEEYGAQNGALAVVHVADFQQLEAMENPNAAFGGFGGGAGGGRGLNGPPYSVPKLHSAETCASVPEINAGLAMTSAIFQDEKKSGPEIFYAAGSNVKQDSFELNSAKTLKLHVPVKSEAGHAENVVAMLEGSDPVKKNEYVVISAHLDHIGFSAPLPNGHNVNNGADDDGSGSVGVLAMAHAYAEGAAKGIRPERSIIFLWNAGEEKGLWGSQYFSEYPPVDPTKIVADLNIDMIGRTKGPGFTDPDKTHVLVNPGEILLIGPNISSDDLEKTIETVNNGYQKLSLNHFYDVTKPDATHDNLGPQPNGQRIFYRSDHYNFAKIGIPIAFFTTGLHPDYHRPTDTPEKIDYHEMQIVSRTIAAVAWTLANQDARPEIKTNLPEQLVKDMKTAKEQGWGKVTPVMAPLPGEPQ
ncbi:MAG TPA: M28 family peptidase [Bryobacteraceae bacterium]|nr:M28 family peptidase [Bryobacteraceae bacterium]